MKLNDIITDTYIIIIMDIYYDTCTLKKIKGGGRGQKKKKIDFKQNVCSYAQKKVTLINVNQCYTMRHNKTQ